MISFLKKSSLSSIRKGRNERPYNLVSWSLSTPNARMTSAAENVKNKTEKANSQSDNLNNSLPLPPTFLREMSCENFDRTTYQRINPYFDLIDGKPLKRPNEERCMQSKMDDIKVENSELIITWKDGMISKYPMNWIRQMSGEEKWSQWNLSKEENDNINERLPWTNLQESDLRSSRMSLPFPDIHNSSESFSKEALRILHQFGILLITDTPSDDKGASIAAFASVVSGGSVKQHETSSSARDVHTDLISHYLDETNQGVTVLPNGTDGPMRTLYGNVWSTQSSGMSEGMSVADSAYGEGSLPLHTDMTYLTDPPGLQVFNMISPSQYGGESVFCDGFAAANYLRTQHPTAFQTLCNTQRSYRCIDAQSGWHLQARGSVIALNNHHEVCQIRHNDLDILPYLPPKDAITELEEEDLYMELAHAHEKWDQVLAMDEMRLLVALKSGDMAVVANQRCLHGRTSFVAGNSSRSVMGCYVSQDELNSRFRMEGFIID